MPKGRSRARESLTGGTGDVNPQWMYCSFTPSTPGTTESVGFQVPVNRLASSPYKSPVLEVLKVVFGFPQLPNIANVAETSLLCTMSLSTKDHEAVGVSLITADTFAYHRRELQGAFTAAGTYAVDNEGEYVFDCTDGAGHGVLVATDTIYGQLEGSATFATFFHAKILYRVKNVSLGEYIGIVQSQQ